YEGVREGGGGCGSRGGGGGARRGGPTMRSMQLLTLIEQVDDVARTLVALREVVNLAGREKWLDDARVYLLDFTDSLSRTCREIAGAVAVRGRSVSTADLESALRKVESFLVPASGSDAPVHSGQQELERTLRHLAKQVITLAEIAGELKSGSEIVRQPPEARFAPKHHGRINPLTEIRNNLTFRSASFQHALRLGVATGLGGLLASV